MTRTQQEYLDKLGPIMSARIKPVHVGWYARDYSSNPKGPGFWLESRDYWDGQHWHVGLDDGSYWDAPDGDPVERWRGLAEKPE